MINDNDDDNNIDNNNNNNNSSKNNNDSNNNNNNNNKYMWVNIKMKPYCLKYRKNTENITPRVSKTSNGRTILLSKCATCDSKKSRFIKNQEAKGLLSNLGIKTPLSKVPILVILCFKSYKMNETVNKLL